MVSTFLGLSKEEYPSYEKAKFVILPVPFEGTVSYGKGTSKGPDAIIKASQQVEFYDIELKKNSYQVGIHTLSSLKVDKNPEKTNQAVYEKAKQLLKDNKFVVMLGGEHSISSGLAKALKEKYSDFSVLQLDAHTDLRETFEGSKYSHACVMKRMYDMNIQAVAVGIRSLCDEEAQLIKNDKLNIFYAEDIKNKDEWMDQVINKLSKNVFITIDVDDFDPSII